MNQFDLERLHGVFTGKLVGRGCGESFLNCNLIAGYIELGVPNIIVVINSYDKQQYFYQMLEDVLEYHGLNSEFKHVNSERFIRVNDTLVRFVPDNRHRSIEEALRGLHDYIIVDERYIDFW